jgi:hypothetical protein
VVLLILIQKRMQGGREEMERRGRRGRRGESGVHCDAVRGGGAANPCFNSGETDASP